MINISDIELDAHTVAAMSKGLNFVPTISNLPVKEILCGIEKAILGVPPELAEEIRRETSSYLVRQSTKDEHE